MTQPSPPCWGIRSACRGWSLQPSGTPAGGTARGSWPPRRLPVLLAVALLAAAAGVPTVFTSAGPAVDPGMRPESAAPSSQVRLLLLAQRAQPTAADDATGTNSCLHVQRHVESGGDIVMVDSLRWITPAGGGAVAQRQMTVHAGTGGADAAALFAGLPDQWSTMTVTTYGPGELASPVGDPVPRDPVALGAQVAVRANAIGGSAAVVAVLVDLASIRYLDVQQRAAVLRVLATLPSLTADEVRTGGADHTGVVFHVDDGTGPVTFTVDPATGRLLSYRPASSVGQHQILLLPDGSRCACPQADRTATAWFWPPVLVRPTGPAAARCASPAADPKLRFLPAADSVFAEATR